MRLYHNPRCSKSRQAVALLSENGVEFEEYRYLDLGIAEEDLEILSSLPGIIRTNEKEFKENKKLILQTDIYLDTMHIIVNDIN